MEFTNEFRVSLPVEAAWDLFTDVERIAPCMPGAQLTEVDGDRFRGAVKVRVGAVTVQYRGTAAFDERDEANRTVRLTASGRDTHGQGNADAHITARLVPDGDGTRVSVETRLSVTGKVAQFGQGVMADISRKLLDRFVACLEEQLAAEHEREPEPEHEHEPEPEPEHEPEPEPEHEPAPEPEASDEAATATRPAAAGPTAAAPAAGPAAPAAGPAAPAREPPAAPSESEPLDLLAVARGPVAKRLVPVVLTGLVLLALARRLRRPCRCPRGGHRA
ncbi:SRPBCC family protein [Kitasatospora sp. NPDC090091]|uniref:SRPBCC family protein n=1 Tax=Kitasatospora sp. NPDC090091 TaxID=3364081 RepID=UPI00380646C8